MIDSHRFCTLFLYTFPRLFWSFLKFEAGELVLIDDDEKKVKELQEGYGGWAPQMKKVTSFLQCWRNNDWKKRRPVRFQR